MKIVVLIVAVIVSCFAQRSPYAGKTPIGYPVIETTITDTNGLGNRFGEGDDSATTVKLPIEALGDAELVRRLSRLPLDQQPFWLINWKALENQRKNPQTYPQRGNSFTNNNSS